VKWVFWRSGYRRSAFGLLVVCACAACEPGQSADDADDDGAGGSGGEAGASCGASPGGYLATYVPVSDNCGGVEALPSERFTVTADGEILTADGRAIDEGSAPSGCVDDDVLIDGCVVSFTRLCDSALLLVGTANVQGDYTLDFERGSGSVAIGISVYDGPTLLQSCQGQQRISISSR
jgi:hypothetical protein